MLVKFIHIKFNILLFLLVISVFGNVIGCLGGLASCVAPGVTSCFTYSHSSQKREEWHLKIAVISSKGLSGTIQKRKIQGGVNASSPTSQNHEPIYLKLEPWLPLNLSTTSRSHMFEPIRGYVIDPNGHVHYVNIPRPDGGGSVTQVPGELRVPDVPYNPGPHPPSVPSDPLRHDTTTHHLEAIYPLDLGPFESFPLLIFGKIVASFSILIPTLLSVAYITLLERKILAFRQFRLGSNKVSWVEILQPIADALKLFSKQVSSPFSSNLFIYIIYPTLSILLMLIIWSLTPLIAGSLSLKYSCVIILVILRFGVYPLLLSGWPSNRKYAILGSLRGVAQTISYEISLALMLLTIILYTSSYEIEEITKFSKLLSLLFVMPLISLLWVISCIAETNRTPFDFSEGESESVSGFNNKYRSGLFTLIFIAEYGKIFFWASFPLLF